MGDSKWYSGLSELTLVASEYYFIVRIISGFFVRSLPLVTRISCSSI